MSYRVRFGNVSFTVHQNTGQDDLVEQVKQAMGNSTDLDIDATTQLGGAPVALTLSGAQVHAAVIDGVPIMNGGPDTDIKANLVVSNGDSHGLVFLTRDLFDKAEAEVAATSHAVPAAPLVREVRFDVAPGHEVVLLIRGRSAKLVEIKG